MASYRQRLMEALFARLRRQVSIAVDATSTAADIRRLQGAQGGIGGLDRRIERIADLQATGAAERRALADAVQAVNEELKVAGARAAKETNETRAEIHQTRAEIDAIRETLLSLHGMVERIEQRDQAGRDDLLTALAPIEGRVIGLARRLDRLEAVRPAPQ